jgi:hypothetical protein
VEWDELEEGETELEIPNKVYHFLSYHCTSKVIAGTVIKLVFGEEN